ncbi:MAG: ABC transporter ATP-binding protein, partial [Micrococcaceae bacterium]|nr:ABC transporter ATP-binding protein [Micrococcaceae bacterium]
ARLSELAADDEAPAMVLGTHHLEEIPPGFTHAMLLNEGNIVSAGPIATTLTHATLASTFYLYLRRRGDSGRNSAVARLGA